MSINGNTLATLKRGQRGIINFVDVTDPQVLRLMVLGLVEGTEIENAGAAIGGDPMEFRLFGCGISLRQEHARHFKISPVAAGD
jgi:Fe2+ transport system protein FeoA